MTLRSAEWFEGDHEVALMHRVAMRSVGLEAASGRPVIGIADSSSHLNSCNLPLRELVGPVSEGIAAAGGVPVPFPVMSLGEDLMKPSAMLYRNLLSIEVEEYVRSYPLDGVVLLANCDKSVPGAVMGAITANVPTLVLTGGARPVSVFRGKRVGTGTDLWRNWEAHRTGELDDAGWAEFEQCLTCGLGACNTMGTASSMAIVTEVLGLALPGSATVPADSDRRVAFARATGVRIVEQVLANIRPRSVLSAAAFANAIRVLHAVGGSTNVLLHLLAIAGRTGAGLTLDEIGRLGAGIPVLADVEPSGTWLIQDFDAAGGTLELFARLADLLDLDAPSASGRTWREEIELRPAPTDPDSRAIRAIAEPLRSNGAFAVVRGSLAPNGAVIKVSAASPELLQHEGPALVFDSYEQMRERVDDPELDATPDTVLVMRGAGPVGVPGMPEWGMVPIPAKLAAAGVRDMVRVTDSRMSGTSFGTCVLHVAPESAVGGPLALVRDGDLIRLDVPTGRLDLLVPEDELARRRDAWTRPRSPHMRGWPMLYEQHVTQADLGCDLDFLRAPDPERQAFVPPVVGRS